MYGPYSRKSTEDRTGPTVRTELRKVETLYNQINDLIHETALRFGPRCDPRKTSRGLSNGAVYYFVMLYGGARSFEVSLAPQPDGTVDVRIGSARDQSRWSFENGGTFSGKDTIESVKNPSGTALADHIVSVVRKNVLAGALDAGFEVQTEPQNDEELDIMVTFRRMLLWTRTYRFTAKVVKHGFFTIERTDYPPPEITETADDLIAYIHRAHKNDVGYELDRLERSLQGLGFYLND
jgi:hypothetical protein